MFKAFGDPARLRLLSLIAFQEGGEACVCELSEGFDLTARRSRTTSRCCARLGLNSGERRGTWVYYRVDTDALHRLSEVLSIPAVSA